MDLDMINSIIDGPSENDKTSKNSLNMEYIEDFLVETREHLESIESSLILLEKQIGDSELISNIFRDFHTIKGLAGFVSQTLVQRIAHQTESLLDRCRRNEIEIDHELIGSILKSADDIKSLCDDLSLADDKNFAQRAQVNLSKIEQLINKSKQEQEQPQAASERISPAKASAQSLPAGKAAAKEDPANIRVPVKKVDSLIDLIGELTLRHSQFQQQAGLATACDNELCNNLQRISAITKEIQNLSMSFRMVSLKSLFQKIYRVGRDTLARLDKNAEILILGENTEIDRAIVEKLADPLVHLINNSIYHGIESAPEREAAGKPPQGKVTIEASRKKGKVFIRVCDDGKGIDIDNVRKKAVQKKLADENKQYSEEEILEFLFVPGFSTLDKADRISGRGVGLDVVKNAVTRMGGRLEVQNELGKGCAFVLELPLNLEIIKGTVVEIEGGSYIIPTLSVCMIYEPQQGEILSVKGINNMLSFREEIIPIIDLEAVFGYKPSKPARLFVVLQSGSRFKALPVSSVTENREIMVKPLGPEFDELCYAFGASILPDGRAAVILDTESLIQRG